MDKAQVVELVDRLRAEPGEADWFEFKESSVIPPEALGEYLSALSNAAALARKRFGYLVLGVHDTTHQVKGTRFDPQNEKVKKNQNLLFWTTRGLAPRVHLEVYEAAHPDGHVVVFEVGPATDEPVTFYGTAYIRVGSSKTALSEHPAKQRALWRLQTDWSAQACSTARLDDLDPAAIVKARSEFLQKHRRQEAEVATWDDATFLNKARLTIRGAVTHAALLLLGRSESASLLAPAVAKASWILKDERNQELDYEHFGPPFILSADKVLARVRNLTLRVLPDGTLFPQEIGQYEPWVIREAMHNAIAHQDYELSGRITLVEFPDRLIITNVGSFLPGSVDRVIEQDAPQEIYRNPFLAEAMVNLNMIDTQGGGIKRMYRTQIARFFPLPDYDLTNDERVSVTIPGSILDEHYTRLLMENTDLALWQVVALDRVQKRRPITKEVHRRLREAKLIEGRYPQAIIASAVARLTGQQVRHIRERGFDHQYYRDLILALLGEHGPADRAAVDALVIPKLPDSLTTQQKKTRVHNLLTSLARAGQIRNLGTRGQPRWSLVR